jgi:2-desacetyl-2-hydroxyethyl bacteriochlorophyllide A dehydrogenase
MTLAVMPDPQPSVKTMRAAVVTGPRTVEVRDVAMPVPEAGQVLVRVEGCGVCASNVPPWEGRDWFTYPLAPGQLGHEAWGTVAEVGDAVTGLSVGQRVAMLSNNAYAEYDLARPEQLVKLPEALAGQPFPAEPLGCAMNIFDRSGIKAGQTVAIIGVGFLGAVLIRLAKQAGARVIAVTQRAFSQEVASRMGADEIVPMDDHWKVIQRVGDLTDGTGGYDVQGFCDVVIECTGKQWPLDLAAELCGVRGRLVIAGYHQDGPRQVNLQLWNWRGLDVINAHERDAAVYRRGMVAAVEAVSSGRLDPSPLYTHWHPLENLADALHQTIDRPDGFVKALILMHGANS